MASLPYLTRFEPNKYSLRSSPSSRNPLHLDAPPSLQLALDPKTSLQALRHELALAHYLNVPTVILPPPRNRAHVADYARAVNASLLSTGSYTPQISIRIPISDPAELVRPGSTGGRASLGGDGLGDDGIGGRRDTGGGLSNRLSTAQVGVQDPSATWEIWDVIRTMCGYNPRLSLSEFPFSIFFPSSVSIAPS
jgi:protein arginine N-methyltransferase 5